jgi:hypothetical protein
MRDFHTFSETAQARIAASGFDPAVIAHEREHPDPMEPMARSRRVEQEQWAGAGKGPKAQAVAPEPVEVVPGVSVSKIKRVRRSARGVVKEK